MENASSKICKTDSACDALPEMELTDGDILDAMRHIPGYIDITTEDFRTIYHLAHCHAVKRLFGGVRAESLMLPVGASLSSAAELLDRSGHKGMSVVDKDGRLLAWLLSKDFFLSHEPENIR